MKFTQFLNEKHTPPLLSLIVPIFNTRNYIKDFLTSLNNQSNKHFEVIFVDDGSTDGTDSFIRRFPLDERISVQVIKQQNQGPGPARWNGLRVASGEYIAFLDSDDWICFDYIRIISDTIKQKKPDVVHYNFIKYYEQNSEYKIESKYSFDNGFIDIETALKRMFPVVWTTIFRKKLIESQVGFPNLRHHEDWFKYYYLLNAKNIYCINKILYVYRLGRDGASGAGLSTRPKEMKKVVDLIIDLTKADKKGQLYKQILTDKSISYLNAMTQPANLTKDSKHHYTFKEKLINRVKRDLKHFKRYSLIKRLEKSRANRFMFIDTE